ncbi:unnamed protein product [Schistosoma bovis]|nr:unnamed protein product [Schistosoma bovis]
MPTCIQTEHLKEINFRQQSSVDIEKDLSYKEKIESPTSESDLDFTISTSTTFCSSAEVWKLRRYFDRCFVQGFNPASVKIVCSHTSSIHNPIYDSSYT